MLLEVQGVAKKYGRKTALDGVSFSLDTGEVVGLAGHNGSGKSTTLRILMGLLEADRGRIEILGVDPITRKHLGQVGWMSERPAFPPRMRIRQILAFQAATMPGWDPALAEQLSQRFEIDPAARGDRLSRGQVARLALLLALAHRPRLLLLDDPCLGLDPQARRLLLGELLASATEAGSGVLLSTHLLAEVDRALDRIVVLQSGKVILDEGVTELRQRCRRLSLPAFADDLPHELAALAAEGGALATQWDEEAWRAFSAELPGALAEPVDLEDIFIAITGTKS